jgi:alanine racemase
MFRPTCARIDLCSLRKNLRKAQEISGKGQAIMAMVKADAYGHGAVEISRALESAGVRALGVATVEEGIELRDAGITVQILVMGGLMGVGSPASRKMVEADLTPVIHSDGVLDSLEDDAKGAGRPIPVHLKIDTGMSRLGIRPESVWTLVEKFRQCKSLHLEGVMTHLADAGDEEFSSEQCRIFYETAKCIEDQLGPIRIWHVANSQAMMNGVCAHVAGDRECWVRPGLALYGDCDGVDAKDGIFEPVMSIVSRAVLVKRVPAGVPVSYGCTYKTSRPSRLAVVPIGYADGYPWSASGRAAALIGGRRVPVVGRVTMDMVVIDVTDVPGAAVNDEVVLVGRQGDEHVTLRELAAWADTIPYDILCRISKRMPRIYEGKL